ncbi:hypothetical protein RBWH47_02231 [Rhodopirellula baltica WH47]|uniref:Uncharacterized protein n=1 Tax=Rhodopirellula baltica WH47 TaxID=991778 RepID=F2AKB2_RHOBT|nr:hypothetical protein RBWH47_02231 [Rhodopirellula baltica WH47]
MFHSRLRIGIIEFDCFNSASARRNPEPSSAPSRQGVDFRTPCDRLIRLEAE